jgi:flagellar hook-associated protein 1 FlgK
MSDFAALNTALTGLLAHRRAMEVIGHNVTNAATEGYSRRRADLQSAGAGVVPGVFSRYDRAGGGVEVAGIVRIRDEFLEARMLREHGTDQMLTARSEILDRIEMSFPEPSETGIARQLAEMWAAWDDVANQPASLSTRVALTERSVTVAQELNRAASELDIAHANAVSRVDALVSEVNANAARVAELNDKIQDATAAGLDPHDLSDQRDQLIERLAELAGVSTRQGDLGSMDVFLGGSALVRGDRAETLEVQQGAGTDPPTLTDPPLFQTTGIIWSKDGYDASVSGGEIAGLLHGLNTTIPTYLDQLDGVARKLAERVNGLHTSGYDLNGDLGVDVFTDDAGSAVLADISARNIRVSDQITGQPERIAASTTYAFDPADPTTPTGGDLGAGIAQQMATVGDGDDSPDAVYEELVGALGVEAQALQRRSLIQDEVTRQVDESRESVRGVSIDEEMVSLVQSQRAYEASARLMTAVDEMIDTLVNRTGLVGR